MTPRPPRRPRTTTRVAAAAVATLVALVLAEVGLRAFEAPCRPLGRLGYADADGNPVADLKKAAERGFVVPVPGEPPRPRFMFAPGLDFFLTYTDQDVLQRDWLDAEGRLPNHINRFGLRERDEITPDKPPGEQRIVCIGDSFTYGWGIPAEANWVRRLEAELRTDGREVRTVNCGASGTVCVDEYWHGLRHRFHAFGPDAVVLTLCLNDLLPSSGLSFQVPIAPTGVRVLDLLRAALGRDPLDLDPARDWVGELLALPREQAEAGGLCNPDRPFEAMWSQGVPQRCLREVRDWCGARQIPLLVVLWPFLQGLGPGRSYPFAKMHALVAAECADAGIPFLDVLPALADTPHEDLWVTPDDLHPNPGAQALALPSIVAFVRRHTE